MMQTTTRIPTKLALAAALPLLLASALYGQDQPVAPAAPPVQTAQPVDRGQSYYHAALAGMYEDQVAATGRPEFVSIAIEEYKKAISADPGSELLQISLAQLYFRAGRATEAEATLRLLLKTSPNQIAAHRLLGRIYLQELGSAQKSVSSTSPAGNPLDKAIQEFETILKLQPDKSEDHLILGQLYSVKQDKEKAEAQFKSAQQLEPDSEEVILNLVRTYSEGGDLARAAKTLENVSVADRSTKMELTLGSIYDQLKQYKDAAAAYQRAAEQEPDAPRILAAAAQSLLSDNQLDPALKLFQQAVDLDPEDTESLIRIGEIQRRQQKYEEALATVRKARLKDPDSLEGGFNEGMLQDVLGHYDEAIAVYQKMVDLTSHANGAYTSEEKNNRSIFLERLASVYHERSKTAEAIDALQKIVAMGGESATRGYQGMVEAYRDAKEFTKAYETARKASDADPKNRDLKLLLASELLDVNKTDEALALAKSMLENKPEDRPILLGIAQMYIRLRRWHEAEDQINKAAALTTKKEDQHYLVFMRGEMAERAKRFDAAEKYFRQALELDPNNSMTLNYLGYMLADKGEHLDEALRFIRKAVEFDPMNGAYLDSLGWIYFKMGQFELAEEAMRRALERDQTDPTIHDHLGDIYEKTGRIRLAAAQWELSLAAYSKSAPSENDPADVAKVQRKLDSAKGKLAKQESALAPSKPE